MKLSAKLSDNKHEIVIRRDGQLIFAEVDGRHYDLESSEPESGVYLFKHKNRIYEVYVSPDGVADIGGNRFDISITDPKRLRGKGKDAEHGNGSAEIKTAMPGKIVRILVAEGDAVEKGDGVIVVEAMKMQNEIKSPKDGRVVEVRVKQGATVTANQVLAIVE